MQLTWVKTSRLLSPGVWVAVIHGIFSPPLPSVSHIIVTLAWRSWSGWQTRACSLSCQLSPFIFSVALLPKSWIFWCVSPHFFCTLFILTHHDLSSLMLVQAVEEFLGEVRSREQPHSAGLVSQPTAVKFLMARKFDVSRAIELFQAYKVRRRVDRWSNSDLLTSTKHHTA